MTPDWLNDAVRAFGRQMGLSAFALNDRGAAGVRFENGLSFRLEYAQESLMVFMGVPTDPSDAVLKRLFVAVHPSAQRSARIRAAYLSRAGEAVYAIRLPERDVNVTSLETAFRELWRAADALRRTVS